MNPAFTISLLCFSLLLSACNHPSEDFGSHPPKSTRWLQMSAEKKKDMAPNQLFIDVWNGDADGALKVLKAAPALAESENTDGDTPLGVALQLDERDLAETLIATLSAQECLHRNAKGESYVFLSAKAANVEAIRQLADRYYQSLGSFQNYEFSDLDQDNKKGQRALFVAADRHTAEALQTQYYRGWIEKPFWGFMLKTDAQGRTFLHQAAEDGRADVISWAAKEICSPSSWQQSPSWWKRYPAQVIGGAVRGFELFIGDLDSPWDLVFNRRDNDGETALHLALKEHQWPSVYALAGCSWLDYKLVGGDGNLPIQTLLASLNPYEKSATPEERNAFLFLLHQKTRLKRLYTNTADIIDHRNTAGDSALHLAARLADPYFYNTLTEFGNPSIANASGISAEQLFQSRQAQVHAYDQ